MGRELITIQVNFYDPVTKKNATTYIQSTKGTESRDATDYCRQYGYSYRSHR